MLVPVPPDHPFAGIAVKLQRADENIINLENEILRFFQECKYPIIPEPNNERWQDALDYHRGLAIPKRFSVLSGEIVHHWRSCLDHIVWIFSEASYRQANETVIQFPIFIEPPDAKALQRFERQIGGIPNPSKIRDLIVGLQPYKLGINAIDHPLGIIHNMDRFDKHRELVIVQSIGNLTFPADTSSDVIALAAAYSHGKSISDAERSTLFRALNNQGKVLPQVAFAKFGKWEHQFVSPSLRKLSDVIEGVVASFMGAA
jgi:hypothetical protein